MALRSVYLSSDCFHACLAHALSTEREEIMGLLLGEIKQCPDDPNRKQALVWDVCMITRIDKRKDRVEISPEHLVHATTEAERLTETTGRETRVIGWYHSHPHITPWPSHVDLRCQGSYQLMESGFVGLIFSVFNDSEKNTKGSVQVHSFQSFDPNAPIAQQQQPQKKMQQTGSTNLLDFGSSALTAADTHTVSLPGANENNSLIDFGNNSVLHDTSIEIQMLPSPRDDNHMYPTLVGGTSAESEREQQQLQMSGGSDHDVYAYSTYESSNVRSTTYKKVQVPVYVITKSPTSFTTDTHRLQQSTSSPTSTNALPAVAIQRIIELQDILLQEEKSAFQHSIASQTKGASPLLAIHNSAIYQKNVVKLVECFSVPLRRWLDDSLLRSKRQLLSLEEEERKLLDALQQRRHQQQQQQQKQQSS